MGIIVIMPLKVDPRRKLYSNKFLVTLEQQNLFCWHSFNKIFCLINNNIVIPLEILVKDTNSIQTAMPVAAHISVHSQNSPVKFLGFIFFTLLIVQNLYHRKTLISDFSRFWKFQKYWCNEKLLRSFLKWKI